VCVLLSRNVLQHRKQNAPAPDLTPNPKKGAVREHAFDAGAGHARRGRDLERGRKRGESLEKS
jgi:hypothetical protein